MVDLLILWGVFLWAALAILLHLGLILAATLCRPSSWWARPAAQRAEKLRVALAVLISGLFLATLLASCAAPCRPKVPFDRTHPLIQIPTLGSALDSGIGIECRWRY